MDTEKQQPIIMGTLPGVQNDFSEVSEYKKSIDQILPTVIVNEEIFNSVEWLGILNQKNQLDNNQSVEYRNNTISKGFYRHPDFIPITTFGFKKYARAMVKMTTDDKFQKAVYERATKIGALDAGEQLVETVGVARSGEGATGAIQRFLTKGMQVTEQRNRLWSVAVSEVAADDALKALMGKTDDVLVKLDKSSSRRILEDVFQIKDLD